MVRDKKALFLYIAQRYFKFLLHGNARIEVISIANAAEYLFNASDLKTASNQMQRELYRLARDIGWYKDRNEKWRWKLREEAKCLVLEL